MAINSSARGSAPVRLIALHTAEGARKAHDLLAFFHNSKNASSHAIVDHDDTLHILDYNRASWTLRTGNPVSDNLEICAFARWSRAQWLSTDTVDGCVNPRAMVERAGRWVGERARARGIPLVSLSPADVRAGKWGVIDHDKWTRGMNDGTHWDCGGGFPMDVCLDYARGGSPSIPSTPSVSYTEDHMLELTPGVGQSRTLIVPTGARKLVISLGWKQATISKVGFFGKTPEQGINQMQEYGSQVIDPARPYVLDVPSGALTAEVNYDLEAGAVHAVAGFRTDDF